MRGRKRRHIYKTSYLLAIQGVELFDHPCLQLDGLSDVSEDLLEGVGSLLVEEHPHSLAGLHAAADDGHQLGAHEILVLLGLGTVAAGQGLRCFLVGRGLHVDRPVGVDVLGVLHLLEEVVGRADVALPLGNKWDLQ